MDPIDEIKSKLDIVPFISEYVKLSRGGRNFKGLCPFHKEKTPSFMVSPELGIWRCFGACGEGGDVIKFFMKIENLDFSEAVRLLAERTGIVLARKPRTFTDDKEKVYEVNELASKFYAYFLMHHDLGTNAFSYVKQRGMRDETINTFGLGFAPNSPDALQKFIVQKKGYSINDLIRAGLVVEVVDGRNKKTIDRFRNRIVFPLRDHRSQVIGFSGRVLPNNEHKNTGKYINTPETLVYQKRRTVFGLDVTKKDISSYRSVVAVEGEFDLLSCWQNGVKNIVAIKGSAFTQEQMQLISRFADEIVLAFDMDSAGMHAARNALITAEQEGIRVKIVRLVGYKDPDEAVRKNPEAFQEAIKHAESGYDFFINEALRTHDPKTTDGVRRISSEITSLITIISDSIVQAHYIRILADKLRVSEEAVGVQVSRMARKDSNQTIVNHSQISSVKSRRHILEERLVSLALLGMPAFLTDSSIKDILSISVLVRVRECLIDFLAAHQKFSPKKFISFLPPELVEAVTKLLMEESKMENTTEDAVINRELQAIVKEIKIFDVQEKIRALTNRIREAEESGEYADLEKEELSALVDTLAQLGKRQTATNL